LIMRITKHCAESISRSNVLSSNEAFGEIRKSNLKKCGPALLGKLNIFKKFVGTQV
jgi:hypothetical protein